MAEGPLRYHAEVPLGGDRLCIDGPALQAAALLLQSTWRSLVDWQWDVADADGGDDTARDLWHRAHLSRIATAVRQWRCPP